MKRVLRVDTYFNDKPATYEDFNNEKPGVLFEADNVDDAVATANNSSFKGFGEKAYVVITERLPERVNVKFTNKKSGRENSRANITLRGLPAVFDMDMHTGWHIDTGDGNYKEVLHIDLKDNSVMYIEQPIF